MSALRVDLFDYHLPPDRIAQYPAEQRDASRLLELRRGTGELRHRRFSEIAELLHAGDVLVLNDTRVIPARLKGRRERGGGEVELLLLEPMGGVRWRALARPARRMQEAVVAEFGDGRLRATVLAVEEDGVRLVELDHEGALLPLLDEIGRPPLPPYIRREAEPEDRERYQTIYAHEPGAVAAPTAGLHFTEQVLDALAARGVQLGRLTLHVGLGTFQPVRTDRVEDHRMHAEHYRVSEELADLINARTGRLVAVGTTVSRALETAGDREGPIRPGEGRTELFIYPGYRFRAVEAMLTNFHLPRSTLLMMVSAFAGRERILAAYEEAIRAGYRFFSYGDCMFIH